jgi:hypothetical protein
MPPRNPTRSPKNGIVIATKMVNAEKKNLSPQIITNFKRNKRMTILLNLLLYEEAPW